MPTLNSTHHDDGTPAPGSGPEKAAQIWRRRKWTGLLVAGLTLAASLGAVRSLPNLYQSTATVLVEVRSVRSRPVRRRGMKPLVEAVVGDGTGVMTATFFNQPWLANQYKPGTRLMLAGKYQGRNRFRVSTHARTEEVAAVGDAVAEYPATKGITSTQIMARVR